MAKKRKNLNFNKLPQPNLRVLLAAMLLSVLLHLLSYVKLDDFGNWRRQQKEAQIPKKITVRVVPSKPPKPLDESAEDEKKRIVEARQEPTEAPENTQFKGAQDHKTDRETKVKPNPLAARGQDPGQGGSGKEAQAPPPQQQKEAASRKQEILQDPSSNVIVRPKQAERRKPRNAYESLIPNAQDLKKELQAGYQDHIDEDIEVGDRIDINTTNFRYIGYFTTVRKAFELVWTYPSEAARRGLQGEVQVQFTIMKNGSVERIRVVASSGHKILDDAVIEAIQLSSPYGPLPEGFQKEELTVVGSFRYVLSSFAGAY
ncbi:MAG: energy transducer TonB [Oligoflexus sp.]